MRREYRQRIAKVVESSAQQLPHHCSSPSLMLLNKGLEGLVLHTLCKLDLKSPLEERGQRAVRTGATIPKKQISRSSSSERGRPRSRIKTFQEINYYYICVL